MIKIDGSYHEGGGQIVRTALALSTLTGIPFEITDIRKGRSQPGLKNQHLYCIKALEELCGAKTEGVELGSTFLRYKPGKIEAKTINIDIGTAGSITLMMQAVLLPSIFAGSELRLKITGGTDVKWSMPFDFFNNLFVPFLTDLAKIDVNLIRRGYYPKGGGKIDIKIKPNFNAADHDSFDNFLKDLRSKISRFNLIETGNLVKVKGISHASKILENANVADRQAKAAKKKLLECDFGISIEIKSDHYDTYSPGSGITLFAEFDKAILGADALGERGKRSEEVGLEAVNKLISEINSGAPIDQHIADNLIPILGLVGGNIRVSKITSHTLTNIYTVEKFLGKIFSIDEKNSIISVRN